MHLRELRTEDAPMMLEWMHDPEIVSDLKTSFSEKRLQDCVRFIRESKENKQDLHMAIAEDQNDTYLGTVSLKHISGREAEFAIVIRKCAMGTGVSGKAMSCIIAYGFEELGLERIYWCVSPANKRAVRFYDKQGYGRTAVPADTEGYTEEEKRGMYWYAVSKKRQG